MALTRRVMPADYLLAAYNAILACVWGAHLDGAPHGAWIFAAHAAAATLPWLLARTPRLRSGPMALLRDFYPLMFLVVFWPELDLLRDVLRPVYFDEPVAALDRLLFGVHLHEAWMPAMPQLWLSELMFFMYVGYYGLIFLPPVLMAVQGRGDALRDMAFRLMVTFTGCYLIYIAFPVLGPHYLADPYQGSHTAGFFYQLTAGVLESGSSRGAAFPSSHVAGAVTIAFLAWRWFPRWVAWLVALEALGVVLATIYTQNHYAIDSLAGLLFGLGLQVAAVPMIRGWFGPTARVPILPDFAQLFPARPRVESGT